MLNKEASLVAELELILTQEELLWQQKARCNYVQARDRNTKYFHNKTKALRNHTRIDSLKIDRLNWWFDPKELEEAAVSYYSDLFTVEVEPAVETDKPSLFSTITEYDLERLAKPISKEEVHTALFEMSPSKAMGKDVFNTFFYQNNWDTIGDSVWELISKAFETGIFPTEINATLLVLIPKIDSPENLSQFRPISLCNVLYKVITKVLANRMKRIFFLYHC